LAQKVGYPECLGAAASHPEEDLIAFQAKSVEAHLMSARLVGPHTIGAQDVIEQIIQLGVMYPGLQHRGRQVGEKRNAHAGLLQAA
jgi:hypothetical protein